jgi:hypothetical protein
MQDVNVSNLNYVAEIPHNSWVAYSENIYSNKNILHITLHAVDEIGKFVFADIGSRENVEAKILKIIWQNLQNKFTGCDFKDCCVKPDKFHGIILIDHDVNVNVDKVIYKLVSEFKSRSTKLVGIYSSRFGKILWQNGFEKEIISTYVELYGLVNSVWENKK